jgi:hypothetical protein
MILQTSFDEIPEIKKMVQDSGKSDSEVLETLNKIDVFLKDHPEKIESLAQQLAKIPDSLFQSKTNKLPKLNPLYEAAVLERLQFDGDIPELRTAPLPQDTKPAVSVNTMARNPVAIGDMVSKASDDMDAKVREHEARRVSQLEQFFASKGMSNDLVLIKKHAELVQRVGEDRAKELMLLGSAETDYPEYRRGQVSEKASVPVPSGKDLMKMTPAQMKFQAWKFLSTTQGRTSALFAIQEIVSTTLTNAGYDVRTKEYDPLDKTYPITHKAEWSISIMNTMSAQPLFSVVDVAAKVLASRLLEQAPDNTKPLVLLIKPLNKISDRLVGWEALIINPVVRKTLQ